MENNTEIRKVLVNPALAKTLLDANTKNRRVKEPVVSRYANDMKGGRWKQGTFELIKISKDGTVLDGQHRLLAVVKSNTSIFFHIAFGVSDEVFDVLDTGSIRNATDVFKIEGIKHDNVIPSIIQTYFVLLCGGRADGTQKNSRLTNSQLRHEYFLNESFWQETARRSTNWYMAFAKILPPSVFGGMYSFFYSINQAQAGRFIDQLATGISIEHQTINQLRNTLMKDKVAPRKMTVNMKYALIIKAWNLCRINKEIKVLKVDLEREGFPKAI